MSLMSLGAADGELAVVYCCAFLHMACKGSGIWSLDGRRRG